MTSMISRDQVVSIDFSLHDHDGELLDSSAESGPLTYLHGHQQILPGLERALEGQGVGYEARIEVTPEDGFGPRNEELVFDLPRERFDFQPEVGQVLQAQGPGGVSAPFQVVGVGLENITLDGNHPMAGRHLVFSVKVVATRPATEEELAHGHAHDGHSHVH